ncbi:uncharacterized protein LOC110251747 [Exaiptasia diaphana]|uniref:Spindle and kinetochore-associated protein 3 n=1 Tax=Exaiptasia diaphana TaxID=2652724 RepID=A0A913Y3I2_EXADI|nr:uncharacterized protein LOC110251747 [Exaiptasia diaphana]KXJ22818.1 hypothetical protein AC249_AIPGENE26032 [Exaiptasia diaphana]
MAHFGAEFFSQLRSFTKNLDKDCHELKSKIENEEIPSCSEGRAHLILREILSDVQHFKVEVKEKVSQNKSNFTFSEVLGACERLAEHTKTQIDDLQEHLAKYGYKPLEILSVHDVRSKEENNNLNSAPDNDSLDSCQSNDEDDEEKMSTNEEPCEAKQNDEDDVMMTPVKPVTFTKMFEVTPPNTAYQSAEPCTPDQSPVPPKTTTPMINTRSWTQVNQTHNQSFDSPLPPMLNTPGLKMLGSHHHSNSIKVQGCSPVMTDDIDSSPVPPDITCTVLLKPDDLDVPKMKTLPENNIEDLKQKYTKLPQYLQNHFSINEIQHLFQEIDSYLSDYDCNSLSEEVLREVFNLGARTKAFMLILSKFDKAHMSMSNRELTFNQ